MSEAIATAPSAFPWEDEGIYIYNHLVEWHLSDCDPAAWYRILHGLGCTMSANPDGSWSATCRVLPMELVAWKHYLYLSAHSRCQDERSVHITLQYTPLPGGPPPLVVLDESRHAGSIENLLHRLRTEWPGDRMSKQSITCKILFYFDSDRWGQKLTEKKLLPAALQHRGILLEPLTVSWAATNSRFITEITAHASPDYAPAISVKSRSTLSPDAPPFETTRTEAWSELCSILDASSSP